MSQPTPAKPQPPLARSIAAIPRGPFSTRLARYSAAFVAMGAALLAGWPLYALLRDTQPYLTLFAAVAFAAWYSRWLPASLAAAAGFFVARIVWGTGPDQLANSPFVAVDVAEFALSAGSIIFFGEMAHRARERNAAALARLREVLQQLPVGVGLLDLNGRWVVSNPIMDEYVPGAIPMESPDAVSRWKAWDKNGQPIPAERWPNQRALQGEPVPGLEMMYTTDEGRETWVNVSANPLRNERGEIIGATAAVQNIDEAKKAVAERTRLLESERAARASAEEASRMKDEFVAILSHELRTPLNAIRMCTYILERSARDAERVKESAGVIGRNVKLLADLIADLLDIGRIISGKLRLDRSEVNLEEVVDDSLRMVRDAAELKGIALRANVQDGLGPIFGDRSRLQQVLVNLLNNAIKFTENPGSVNVRVESDDSSVTIGVSDTGIGIDPEFLPHVFTRFRQADTTMSRQSTGLGLGLAIVKHIVELHGGSVHAESEGKGHGTRFIVTLPRTASHSTGHATDHPASTQIDLSGITVLTIDDQSDARLLLQRVLEESKAHVIVAASADEGLRHMGDHPDIVLCDLGMPDKDGYQFVSELRARGDKTPALAVTAFARADDKSRALKVGYQGHIAKPVDPLDLIAAIAKLVDEDRDDRSQ